MTLQITLEKTKKFLFDFPSIVTRLFLIFRVTILRKLDIYEYCYSDDPDFQGNNTQEIRHRRVSLLEKSLEKIDFRENV